MKKVCAVLLGLFVPSSVAVCQSAIATESILTRVFMVQSAYFKASIFCVDVDGREYWITAKHVLTGAEHPPYGSLKIESVSLKILDQLSPQEHWIPVTFKVLDPGKDIDIAVLAAPTPLLNKPAASEPLASSTVLIGGDCEFLGFPFGEGWRASFENGQSAWLPYIKHCTVSAMNKDAATIWVLDGINNKGFSGGPVIFSAGADQKIMAVVSGYETELAQVSPSAAHKRAQKPAQRASAGGTVTLNAGFIVAYDTSYALDAIHKNPIGPLRPSN